MEKILENNQEINTNEITLEEKQNKFINTMLGKTINSAIDIGLRFILPDLIENQIIDIKNAILQNGLKDGIDTAIKSVIGFGKSATGIVTGKFENVGQIKTAVGSGGIIDTISKLLDKAVNKAYEKDLINNTVVGIIKTGKNVILSNVKNNIENTLEEQTSDVKQLSNHIDNWKMFYNNQNFEGMTKEYNKIKNNIKNIIPLENILKETSRIEILQNLIKNNGKNFELSKEELELVNKLN